MFPFHSFTDVLRAVAKGGQYPILLPHVELVQAAGGLRTPDMVGGAVHHASPSLLAGLSLCDGTRTLRQICRTAGISGIELISLRRQGLLIFWPSPLGQMAQDVDGGAIEFIISPHPDDAALSAAAILAGAGRKTVGSVSRIVLMDCFTRAAWWRLPRVAAPSEIQRFRAAEESLLARLCGVALMELGLPEALLRGQTIQSVTTAEPSAADEMVRTEIEATITSHAAKCDLWQCRWHLPLGVGNHLDHRIVRDASLAALRRLGVGEGTISFYEELPYTADAGGQVEPQLAALRTFGFNGGQPLVLHDRKISASLKWDMLRIYWTQLTKSQIRQVVDYRCRRRRAVERYWEMPAPL